MTIKGIETIKRPATVEITVTDCFRSLCFALGVGRILYPDSGKRYMPIEKNGEIVKLIEQEDISRHGSPCWDSTGVEITDPETIEIYRHCKALKTIIRAKAL